MKVLTTHEFHYIQYENGFYDPRNYTSGYYDDLLSVFDKVIVVGRCKKVVTKPDCQRVDSNRTEFFPVCDFCGYGDFIGLLRAFWQCRKAVGLADRYWLRAPGFIASMVAFWLRQAKIPYYIRLVGDPAEVAETKTMWVPKLISKVIISYVQRRFKKEVASSGGVLASTKYTLQKRYPSKIPENDFFATTLSLSQAIFKNVSRNFNDNVFRIIIVGVLLKYKGHDYLLKALAKIQDQRKWSLLAVGQGPELKNLEQLANEAGIGDRVCFCPPLIITKEEVDRALDILQPILSNLKPKPSLS